jgi:hypothetical protein
MTRHTFSKTQIASRRLKVAELYLHGASQNAIADKVGVDQGTISRDLKVLRAEWLKSALVDINEAKARELAKIDALEATYWQAWARSLHNAVTVTQEKLTGKEREAAAMVLASRAGAPVEAIMREVEKREGQSGNPAFLAGVMNCINRRCDILGLDAPKENKLSGSVELSSKHDLSKLTDDELRAWRELMLKTNGQT